MNDSKIYHVDDIRHVEYGSNWYKCHRYKDYGNYRVSERYHFYGGTKGKWYLSIASKSAFVWKNRRNNYKKMTEKQLDHIVDTFVKSFIKAGDVKNVDLETLRSAIRFELEIRFLKSRYN